MAEDDLEQRLRDPAFGGRMGLIGAEAADRLKRYREALKIARDELAFIINHVTMPSQWYDRFQAKVEALDKALQNEVKG